MDGHLKGRGWIGGYNVEYLMLYSTFAMLSILIAIFFYQLKDPNPIEVGSQVHLLHLSVGTFNLSILYFIYIWM